jgi:hypothetical protein
MQSAPGRSFAEGLIGQLFFEPFRKSARQFFKTLKHANQPSPSNLDLPDFISVFS